VEEQGQESDLDALAGEVVSVASAIALEQGMAFEFAKIVAKLVQPVGFGGKLDELGWRGTYDADSSVNVAVCLVGVSCAGFLN
jgi:hypothetical protein